MECEPTESKANGAPGHHLTSEIPEGRAAMPATESLEGGVISPWLSLFVLGRMTSFSDPENYCKTPLH